MSNWWQSAQVGLWVWIIVGANQSNLRLFDIGWGIAFPIEEISRGQGLVHKGMPFHHMPILVYPSIPLLFQGHFIRVLGLKWATKGGVFPKVSHPFFSTLGGLGYVGLVEAQAQWTQEWETFLLGESGGATGTISCHESSDVGLDRTLGADFPRQVERSLCPFATSTTAACPLNHCGGV